VPLSISTLNVENLSKPKPSESEAKKQQYKQRLSLLRDIIFRLDADILALQELISPKALDDLFGLNFPSPFQPYKKPYVIGKPAERGVRCAVLSRFESGPKIDHETVAKFTWPDRGIEWQLEWDRPLLQVPVKVNSNLVITLFVVHLKSKMVTFPTGVDYSRYEWPNLKYYAQGSFLSTLRRVGQAMDLREKLDAVFERDPEANIVVLGDFNDGLGSVTLDTIVGDHIGANNTKLWDFELVPCELSLPTEKQYTYIFRGKGIMLDHILISKNMLPFFKFATVYNELLKEEHVPYRGEKFFSEPDHAPVIAYFTYQP